MFGDLDWPLNASRGLSAIAEFLVDYVYTQRTMLNAACVARLVLFVYLFMLFCLRVCVWTLRPCSHWPICRRHIGQCEQHIIQQQFKLGAPNLTQRLITMTLWPWPATCRYSLGFGVERSKVRVAASKSVKMSWFLKQIKLQILVFVIIESGRGTECQMN